MNKNLYLSSYNRVKGFLNVEEPAFGFSLRDLRGDDPICVRVRRTLDNTQRDFRPSEIADGSLYVWVDGDYDGFVTRWYNQFDETEYYEQNTTSVQPQIARESGGGIADAVTSDGQPFIPLQPYSIPSIDFGGFGFVTNGYLTGGDYTPDQNLLIVAVVAPAAIDPSVDGFIFDNFTSSGRGLLQDDFGGGTYTFINDTSSTTPDRLRVPVPNTNLDEALVVITARIKADLVTIANNRFEIYLNGVLGNSDNGRLLSYQARTGDTVIGAGTSGGSFPYKGKISEILIYRGNSLDYTQKIVEKNVISYYLRDLHI